MRYAFYDSEEYRTKQSNITSRNQKKGVYAFQKNTVSRKCTKADCEIVFVTTAANKKKYCSSRCAAIVNNTKRRWSEEIKLKISNAHKGKKSPFKGTIRVPRVLIVCGNPDCKKEFYAERYKNRRFCTDVCAIRLYGRYPTSPKASRGKAGIRLDIDPELYFYSRWEANMARLYTHLGIRWVFEPKTFDIGKQTYTPDFYLPDTDTYIEVKNFWGEYSRIRDAKFRTRYPHLKLHVILKDEYRALEQEHAKDIPLWEFKNSPFN